jgi:hypothetical protein
MVLQWNEEAQPLILPDKIQFGGKQFHFKKAKNLTHFFSP